MALLPDNAAAIESTLLAIDGVDWGLVSDAGIAFEIEGELTELKAGQSAATLARVVKVRNAKVSGALVELLLAHLADILNTQTAYDPSGGASVNGLLTGDVARGLTQHTLALTFTLSNGDVWLVEATVEFDPFAVISGDLEQGEIPFVANCIPDLTSTGGVFTIQRTATSAVVLAVSSSVPTDEATGVVVSDNITWAMNLGIHLSSVNAENFSAIRTSTGVIVAGALSYSATTKTITLNPTSDLEASEVYNLRVDKRVKPISGAAMAATVVANFTTAA